jgi:hypothetical protein
MACLFDKNISNWLGYGAGGWGGISGSPGLSFHCWIWIPASTMNTGVNDNGIFTLIVNANSVGFVANVDQSVGGVPKLRLSARSVGTDARQAHNGTTTLSTGQWLAVGGSVDFSSKIMKMYLNGALDGTSAAKTFANTTYTLGTPTAQDTVGGLFTPTPATIDQLGGHIAELGIYKDVLGDEDFVGLARYEPSLVRPNLLFDAVSFINSSRIHGIRGKVTGTITGTINQSTVDPSHPRILRA